MAMAMAMPMPMPMPSFLAWRMPPWLEPVHGSDEAAKPLLSSLQYNSWRQSPTSQPLAVGHVIAGSGGSAEMACRSGLEVRLEQAQDPLERWNVLFVELTQLSGVNVEDCNHLIGAVLRGGEHRQRDLAL